MANGESKIRARRNASRAAPIVLARDLLVLEPRLPSGD